MKHRIMMLMAVLVAAVAVVALSACANGGGKQNAALQEGQRTVNRDLSYLNRVEPLPRMLDSADRRIQNYYYSSEADPNKTWYLETESMTGQVKGSYTIRGPVENVSDQVTNPSQIDCLRYHEDSECGVIGLAEPNGIYPGASNDHIAILSSGAILRWEGLYETSDQPFTVKTPELVTINGSAPISRTDLSKTEGGKLPPRR